MGFPAISGPDEAEFHSPNSCGSVTLRKQNEGGELEEGTEKIRV